MNVIEDRGLTKKMGAVFSLDDTITLAGRGLVLTGQIVDGVIRVGDQVRWSTGGSDQLARITAVERGHRRMLDGSPGGFVGLVLGELTANEIPLVRAALSPGQRLRIELAS